MGTVNSGWSEVIGSCSGSSASKYYVWIEYLVSGTTVYLRSYLRRNDGWAQSFYNLGGTVYRYVQCGSSQSGGNGNVDTRNGAIAELYSATYSNVSGTITLSGGFSNTGVSELTGGSASTTITISKAPTSTSLSLSADTSHTAGSIYDATGGVAKGRINLNASSSGAVGGGTIYYKYGWQVNGGTWQYSGNTTSSTYGISLGTSTFPRGATVKFGVMSYNSVGNGPWAYKTIVVNSPPPTPTSIWVDTATPTESLKLSWSASTDPNGHGVVYDVFSKIGDGDYSYVEWTNNTSYGFDMKGFEPGTKFGFKIQTHDTWNDYSNPIAKDNMATKANRNPSTPGNLRVNNTRPINSITVSWDASTDPDTSVGDVITYELQKQIGSGSWTVVGTTTSTSLTYNCFNDPEGSIYNFSVIARDKYNGASSWNTVNSMAIRATRPNTPILTLDKTGVIEGVVTAKASTTCTYPPTTGSLEYKFGYQWEGYSWVYTSWSTADSIQINLTNEEWKRGLLCKIAVAARNDAGDSAWASNYEVRANAIPSKVTNISCNPVSPNKSTTISWSASTHADGEPVTYHVYAQDPYEEVWTKIATTTSLSCVYDMSQVEYGGWRQVKIEAKDSLGTYHEPTREDYLDIYKVGYPEPPRIAQLDGVFENAIKITWANAHFGGVGVTGTFILEAMWGENTEWTQVIETPEYTHTVYIADKISRGEKAFFRVIAKNEYGLLSSNLGIANVFCATRNSAPTQVTITPNGGIFMNNINLKWTASTDIDGHSVSYKVYISRNGGAYTHLGDTTNTSYAWSKPNSDATGMKYKFKVISLDELGAQTETITKDFVMPTPPTAPTNLLPADKTVLRDTFDMSWTASNFFGYEGSYKVSIYINDELNSTHTIDDALTSFSKDITNVSQSSLLYYTIYAENIYGQRSATVRMNGTARRKDKPTQPSIILPVSNAHIDTTNPRFIVKAGKDSEGGPVSLTVKYNGATYNSKTHTSMFSRTTTSNQEYFIIRIPDNSGGGSVKTFKVATDDGYSVSNEVSINIYKYCTVQGEVTAGKDFVTDDIYNNMKSAINRLAASYEVEQGNFPTINNTMYISKSYISAYIQKLKTIENKINSYHTNNKFSVSYELSSSLYVEASDNNKIMNMINAIQK